VEASDGTTAKITTLADAVAEHVSAGDVIHPVVGHTRWTALNNEVVRQWWGRDPQFTLVMLSLSTLGTVFFRGGLVQHVITGYSGDTFPNFTPNPVFANAYKRGDVTVEHWSFLAFSQRLEAAAKGLPAAVTRSIAGSSMEANDAFSEIDTPFGRAGLLAPLAPDVALLHAPVADREGNVAFHPPLLENVWGALAAKRGALVTVEKIVDDLRDYSSLVKIPAHQVLAVVEAPFGAHPGGLYTGALPVDGYGEDYEFWVEARAALRNDDTADAWIDQWVRNVDHAEYVEQLGADKRNFLLAKASPDSWRSDEAAYPPDLDAPPNSWEIAASYGARYLAERAHATNAHAVLAGAGVANLAAWLGVELARAQGSGVLLTAEIGLWDYTPVPADPFVLNHRNFPTAAMLGDAAMVLGTLVGGPNTTTIGCLGGAQVDRFANINSTLVANDDGTIATFLVGSGGGNDVASTCAEAVVVATLTPQRTPAECSYVTSPGRTVRALVTDLGILEKDETGELDLVAVPPGAGAVAERVAAAQAGCGWELRADAEVAELPPVDPTDIARLRQWDPRGWFLRG